MRAVVIGMCLGLISCEKKSEEPVDYHLHGKLGDQVIEIPTVNYAEVLEVGVPFVEVIFDGESFELWAEGVCRHKGMSLGDDAMSEMFGWAKDWMNAKGFEPQVVFTLPKTLKFESIRRLHRMVGSTGMVYAAFAVSTGNNGEMTRVVRARQPWMSEGRAEEGSTIPSIFLKDGPSLNVGSSEGLLDLGFASSESLEKLADYLVMVKNSLPISSGGIHRTDLPYIYIQIDSNVECRLVAEVASVVAENGIDLIVSPESFFEWN